MFMLQTYLRSPALVNLVLNTTGLFSGTAFFTLLAQHHLPAWLLEHEKGEGDEGTGDGLWEVRTG